MALLVVMSDLMKIRALYQTENIAVRALSDRNKPRGQLFIRQVWRLHPVFC